MSLGEAPVADGVGELGGSGDKVGPPADEVPATYSGLSSAEDGPDGVNVVGGPYNVYGGDADVGYFEPGA